MRERRYNFMLCVVDGNKVVVTQNFTLTHDRFTITPSGNNEVITLLDTGNRYVINKKIVESGKEYCVVCESIRTDRLLAKCKKILGIVDLPKPIASCPISNTASLNIYEIVDGTDTRVRAGINNTQPRMYKLYYNNGNQYFNYGGNKYYLQEFMRC